MKVLLYSKMFPRIGNDSFGSYVYEQISELVALGVDIKIVSPHMYIPPFLKPLGGKFAQYASAPCEYTYRGLKVYSPPCLWAKELGNSTPELKYKIYRSSMRKYILNICESFKPDIIYGLDPILDGRLCAEIGKELNIPVVLIEHSVPANYRNLINNAKAIALYAKVMKMVNGTIFVTNSQKSLFEKMIGDKINGQVVYNGFRYEEINDITPYDQTDCFKMISIGFLEDRKGYPTTFEALKMLKTNTNKDFKLIVLGDGYDKTRYEEMVIQMGLSDNVEFKGIVSHGEVFAHLNSSDLFVLPSYEESFGIVYLEAMSCNVPVIGTNGEGISDIIENGKNGFLIDKGDSYGLYKTIDYVMNNPQEVAMIVSNASETVAELSWTQNAKEVLNIFTNILKSE